MVAFMDGHGFDMSSATPRALADEQEHLDRYSVIVSLDAPARSYVPRVPFHTSALTWDVGAASAETGEDDPAQRFETLYRDLAVRIDDLMQVLRGGEEA